ncbi:MAG: hypothetical protein QW270_03935 [Candidatus Bathyarchaeia archaeon]
MIRVNVSITNVSAERFWDIRKPFPPIQVNINLSVPEMEKKTDFLEAPFIFTVNFNPSLAQINLKGKAYIAGDAGEIERICKDFEEKKPPPPIIAQSISNVALIESVIISRTLNIPPPIPLPQIPPPQQPSKKPSEMDYSA